MQQRPKQEEEQEQEQEQEGVVFIRENRGGSAQHATREEEQEDLFAVVLAADSIFGH